MRLLLFNAKDIIKAKLTPKPLQMNEAYLLDVLKDKIKSKILEKTGYSNPKYIQLADIIEKTKIGVSVPTLARVLEIVTVTSTFREDTLNILSRFVGYSSWEELCASYQISAFAPAPTQDNALNGVVPCLRICLENEHFKSVLDIINQLDVPYGKKQSVEANMQVSWLLGEAILTSKKAAKALLPALAQTQAGQYYFYEDFVTSDPIYLNALKVHYLPAINENNTNQAKYTKLKDQAFAYSLLYEHYCNQKNHKGMNEIGCNLFKYGIDDAQANFGNLQDIRPYARFWSQKLIYLHHQTNQNLSTNAMEDIVKKLTDCIGFNDHPFAIAQLIASLGVVKETKQISQLIIAIYEDFNRQHQPTTTWYKSDWYLSCMMNVWSVVVVAYQTDKQVDKAQKLALKIVENMVTHKNHFSIQLQLFKELQPIIQDFEKLASLHIKSL